MHMLIYSPDISPRLKYTLDLVFRSILQVDYRITNVKDEIANHSGARLNYSSENIEGVPFLQAHGLLFQDNILELDIDIKNKLVWKGLTAFFPVGSNSLIPFDIFSAIFYLVSRYEEYLPFEADFHNRFHSKLSISSKLGILDKPIVDQWVINLGEVLESIFPDDFKRKATVFRFEPTIDIDNAWAFKNKGIWRTFGATFRKDQNMETRNFRYQVLRGKQADPFDQYKKIERIHSDFGFRPRFFFLVGKYGKYDKNISPNRKAYRELIRDLSIKNITGLHPSYSSFCKPDVIANEKSILTEITGQEINCSRQHYLRIQFPLTYQSLIKAGISEDFSMGYADRAGFRAGISRPYFFFDLVNNKQTSLRVFPFQVMDTGLRDYEKCTAEEAVKKIRLLMERTREVGGLFMCLWHNESFSEWSGWEGWTDVYRNMLLMARNN